MATFTRFLDLAPELRIHIYEALHSNLDPTPHARLEVCEFAYNALPSFNSAMIVDPKTVPFLQSCKTVHREFMAHRWQKATCEVLITGGKDEHMRGLYHSLGSVGQMKMWPFIRTLELCVLIATKSELPFSSSALVSRLKNMVDIINNRMRLRKLDLRVTWHYGYPPCLEDVVNALSMINVMQHPDDTGAEEVNVRVHGDMDDEEAGDVKARLDRAIKS